VALALNGVFPQPGSNVILDQQRGLKDVSTIIHVRTVPATLSIVNYGAADFTVGAPGGLPGQPNVAAFISLEKLHNLPTP
jgi:hypothetical protein